MEPGNDDRSCPPAARPHVICTTRMTIATPTLPSKAKKVDFAKIRADFPILDQKVHGHPLIYFDNAATTQKPRAMLDVLRCYYEKDNANVHRGIHELSNRATAAFEAARERSEE